MPDGWSINCCVLHSGACRKPRWQLLQQFMLLLGVAAAETQSICVAVAQCPKLLAGQSHAAEGVVCLQLRQQVLYPHCIVTPS